MNNLSNFRKSKTGRILLVVSLLINVVLIATNINFMYAFISIAFVLTPIIYTILLLRND